MRFAAATAAVYLPGQQCEILGIARSLSFYIKQLADYMQHVVHVQQQQHKEEEEGGSGDCCCWLGQPTTTAAAATTPIIFLSIYKTTLV